MLAPSKPKRLAVARFWYEGNAFTPLSCTLGDFERKEWSMGAPALAAAKGVATELGAVVDFAARHPDWDVVALRCASAWPGGPIEDHVYDMIERDLLDGLLNGARQAPWDAVYLSLHGASITRARQTPDLDLIRAVRGVAPHVPLGVSFDLHANLSPGLAGLVDVVSGYKTYPHVDQYRTAERVLDQLVLMVEQGARRRVCVGKPGLVLPSFNMRTDSGPMRDLQDLAAAQTHAPVIEVSVFGGFPYADTPDTGASVVVTTDAARDPAGAGARVVVDRLEAAMREKAHEFMISLPSASVGLERALAIIGEREGMVVVTDPGDNPGSGGIADTPGLLQAVLGVDFDATCVFASFADAKAVQSIYAAGVGNELDLMLGGQASKRCGAALPVRARVETLTDGEFRNVGPKENGALMRCGRTAMIALAGRPNIHIIVTEVVVPANDPAFFTMHGIDFSEVRLLCVKAKNHFRAAFLPLSSAIIDIDAPGPAALNLSSLPFRHAPGVAPD